LWTAKAEDVQFERQQLWNMDRKIAGPHSATGLLQTEQKLITFKFVGQAFYLAKESKEDGTLVQPGARCLVQSKTLFSKFSLAAYSIQILMALS
jgi:hypothetical protein